MSKLFKSSKSLVFFDIFFKITAITVLLIVLLSSLLYYYFRSTSTEMLSGANIKVLSQMSYMSRFIHTNSVNFILSIYDSVGAKNLMYRKNIDSLELVRGIDGIRNMLDNSPFVHSIYIYNRNSGTVYIFGEQQTNMRVEDFSDDEALNIITDRKKPGKLLPLARKISVFQNEKLENINVYTYYLFEGNMSSAAVEGAVIINIKADWVYESINLLNEKNSGNESEILVVDDAGRIVGSSQKHMYMENISKYPDIADKINKEWNSKMVTAEFAGRKYIMNSALGDIIPWKFVILTPYDSFFEPVNSAMEKIISISSGVFVFALIIVFFLSRMMYNPIKVLWSALGFSNTIREYEPEGYRRAFDRVTQTVTNTATHLSALQTFKRDNIKVIRQDYLRRLLSSEKSYKKQEIEARLKEYDIKLTLDESFLVAVVRVDSYQDFMDDGQLGWDRDLLLFALLNMIEEAFSRHFKCGFVDEGRDLAVGLLNLNDACEINGEVFDKLTSCINEIHESVQNYLKLSLSFSLSSVSDDSSVIHQLYQEALDNSNYRLIFGKGSLITPDMVAENRNKKMESFPKHFVECLKEDVRYGRLENMREDMGSIIGYIEKYSYNDIIITINYITVEIFNTIEEMMKNGIHSIDQDYSSFSRKISLSKSINEIKCNYNNLFEIVALSIERDRNGKTHEIVGFAKKIIEENYTDPNLSLSTISDRLKMSTVYMGSLFKSMEECSISDYIQKIRVKNSAKLLTETNRSISEILDIIGWENKKYFNTIFKKYYSVTPSEYRIQKTVKN